MAEELDNQIQRRRTFAIISHPDAGKTTLTEKLLLYGGAVRLAGSVRARRNQRQATSDWMAMEQQRGISITTTVLQFNYAGHVINLLDTPGHQDFSEDTYRTVTAADSVVMLIDSANGIETQTRKLFAVARLRKLPVFTFINKMDRPGRNPLDLIDEIEREFGIVAFPVTWPIGEGDGFRGVYDRIDRKVHLFERTASGALPAPISVKDASDPTLERIIGATNYQRLQEDAELLEGAGAEFDRDAYLRGEITPVFFGSAVTNFGVEPFLDRLLQLAPAPAARPTIAGDSVSPDDETFTGFVFKIQANMDKQHRDRVAFLRVVSGRFERDMVVTNARSGKKVRLSRPQKLFAAEREITEEAYPGDIIGLTNPGAFAIGDSVSSGPLVAYEGIPQFSPEQFAIVRPSTPTKRKQLLKGLDQLREEGAIQVMWEKGRSSPDPILAAVGALQFD
ncbi:MAG TPA: peptide chain release factor 3, partial [Blastocatellia bacterium]|nr:peptide chain release factor 3 [Blastocatellia bacterium]